MKPETQFIYENAHLFWWIPEDKKKDLPFESVVEAILNYGDEKSVKKLFEIYSISKVAEVFYNQIRKERSNYLPQVKHYFSLYFKKYA